MAKTYKDMRGDSKAKVRRKEYGRRRKKEFRVQSSVRLKAAQAPTYLAPWRLTGDIS